MSRTKRKRADEDPEKTETCAICREEKKVKDLVILNTCSHKFCPDCITPWFERDNSCPCCRKKVNLIDIPGRKRRKRVKEATQVADEDETQLSGQDIVNTTVMSYISNASFRRHVAVNVLKGDEMILGMWEIIKYAIPRIIRRVRHRASREVRPFLLDMLDAYDCCVRLQAAINHKTRTYECI